MRKLATALYAAALLAASTGSLALAQITAPPGEDPCKNPTYRQCYQGLPVRTLSLSNATQQADANEIVAAIRNILPPESKIYLVSSRNAIIVRAMPDDIALAQKLISDLDKPKKTYRLTYTVTEMDGIKKIGSQRFAMVLASGQDTSLKLGNKVPIVTDAASAGGQTQYTYVDVGMSFDATLIEMGENAMLKSSVDQSSVAPEKTDIAGVREPIIRQATLRGESLLAPHKPLMLGSVDIPSSTNHLDIEVLMEPLP
jgi:hypothetical protein